MIYLDNSSSTQPKFFAKDYSDYWMNANSSYSLKEQQALENAKDRIKQCIGVKSGRVIFGRCATELVEYLCREMNKYSDIVVACSECEHDSCYDAVKDCRFYYTGEATSDIDLYLHQYVNQVTGNVFNIQDIEKRMREAMLQIKGLERDAFFVSDFTSAIGHAPIPKNLDTFCDAIWFSGHKFNAEKGCGAMWLSDCLCAHIGASESPRNNHNILHGTTALPSILALTDALEYTISNFPKNEAKYRELHDYMFHYATDKGLYIYEKIEDSCPAINAITIPFVNADALCNYLASKEIYVGKGSSACSNEADYRVLEAQGYTKEQAEQTIRVSFGEDNTLEDVEKLIESVIEFKEKF